MTIETEAAPSRHKLPASKFKTCAGRLGITPELSGFDAFVGVAFMAASLRASRLYFERLRTGWFHAVPEWMSESSLRPIFMPDSRWASISTIEILTIEVRRKVRRMMKGPVETTAYIRCCAGGPGHHPCVARRSELVALEVRDIDFWPNGTGQAVIRRGKTDSEGQGRVAYLSRETVRWLKIWLEHATINEGPIFRRFIGRDQIGNALHPGSIAPIFKRVAQWIGMPAKFVAEVSGHSTRVGAAQDLAELDIDLAATGRDKSVPEEG